MVEEILEMVYIVHINDSTVDFLKQNPDVQALRRPTF